MTGGVWQLPGDSQPTYDDGYIRGLEVAVEWAATLAEADQTGWDERGKYDQLTAARLLNGLQAMLLSARGRLQRPEPYRPPPSTQIPRDPDGYARAVARLRDDDAYRSWWTARGYPPGERYWETAPRNHLADYLETTRILTDPRPDRQPPPCRTRNDCTEGGRWGGTGQLPPDHLIWTDPDGASYLAHCCAWTDHPGTVGGTTIRNHTDPCLQHKTIEATTPQAPTGQPIPDQDT